MLSIFHWSWLGPSGLQKNQYLLFSSWSSTQHFGLTFSRSAWLDWRLAVWPQPLTVLIHRPIKNELLPWLFISCVLTVAVGDDCTQARRGGGSNFPPKFDRSQTNTRLGDVQCQPCWSHSRLWPTAPRKQPVSFHGRPPNNVFLQLFAFEESQPSSSVGYGLIKLLLTLWKKYPKLSSQPLVLLVLAQFNAVLLELFVLLLGGTQLILLTQLPPTLKNKTYLGFIVNHQILGILIACFISNHKVNRIFALAQLQLVGKLPSARANKKRSLIATLALASVCPARVNSRFSYLLPPFGLGYSRQVPKSGL